MCVGFLFFGTSLPGLIALFALATVNSVCDLISSIVVGVLGPVSPPRRPSGTRPCSHLPVRSHYGRFRSPLLQRLLSEDPASCHELGQAAHTRVHGMFSWRAIAEQHLETYERALHAARS